ncbi:hypothetical protein BH09MYX1_BH09MYX1_52240 [soil metagenome]
MIRGQSARTTFRVVVLAALFSVGCGNCEKTGDEPAQPGVKQPDPMFRGAARPAFLGASDASAE